MASVWFLKKSHTKETKSEQISRFHACAHIYPFDVQPCLKKWKSSTHVLKTGHGCYTLRILILYGIIKSKPFGVLLASNIEVGFLLKQQHSLSLGHQSACM